MKLWQKIFLLTLTLVIIVVNTSSLAVLYNNHRLSIEREQDNALARHNYIDLAINNTIVYTQLIHNKSSLSDDELLASIVEVLQQQSDANMGVSFYKDRTLLHEVNQTDDVTELRLLQERDYTSIISQLGGRTYLYIVSTTALNDQVFQLVTSYDITATDESFKQDFAQTRLISIISALFISGLLILLVRGLLSPLRDLSNTTDRIASGDLDKRATIKGHDEVADVARNFNIMADSIEKNVNELEDIAESRKVFIGNLAHEMKTPLTSILGYADILRVKRKVSDEERVEYSGVIVNETKRLQNLSGKLMELLTLGNLQISPESVEVHDFVSDLLTILQPIAASHSITLKPELMSKSVRIKIDPELMKSFVFNLVDNAIKASEPNATIKLVVKEADGEENKIKIAVIDSGVGIPPEEIQYLTEPFYMLDKARTRKFGGAGLGLALCHEIALAHGTELAIVSVQDKGTEASVLLEIEAAADPKPTVSTKKELKKEPKNESARGSKKSKQERKEAAKAQKQTEDEQDASTAPIKDAKDG